MILRKVLRDPIELADPLSVLRWRDCLLESHLHFEGIKVRDHRCHALKMNAPRQIASGNCHTCRLSLTVFPTSLNVIDDDSMRDAVRIFLADRAVAVVPTVSA